jgi:hypothetical protein
MLDDKTDKHLIAKYGLTIGKSYARQVKRRIRLRAAVIAFLGGKCAGCDVDDVRVLQLDHIAGGGSADRKRKGGWLAMYRRVLAGAVGYQLLCANCNWIKRYERDEHGGGIARGLP